jgi:hypothetical protein
MYRAPRRCGVRALLDATTEGARWLLSDVLRALRRSLGAAFPLPSAVPLPGPLRALAWGWVGRSVLRAVDARPRRALLFVHAGPCPRVPVRGLRELSRSGRGLQSISRADLQRPAIDGPVRVGDVGGHLRRVLSRQARWSGRPRVVATRGRPFATLVPLAFWCPSPRPRGAQVHLPLCWVQPLPDWFGRA